MRDIDAEFSQAAALALLVIALVMGSVIGSASLMCLAVVGIVLLVIVIVWGVGP